MTFTPCHWCMETEDVDDVTVIHLTGKTVRLGEQHIQILDEQVQFLVERLGRRKVNLEFDNVECVASTALAKLLALHKKVQALGGRLSLCDLLPHVYEIFEMSQLDKVLDLHRSEGVLVPWDAAAEAAQTA